MDETKRKDCSKSPLQIRMLSITAQHHYTSAWVAASSERGEGGREFSGLAATKMSASPTPSSSVDSSGELMTLLKPSPVNLGDGNPVTQPLSSPPVHKSFELVRGHPPLFEQHSRGSGTNTTDVDYSYVQFLNDGSQARLFFVAHFQKLNETES